MNPSDAAPDHDAEARLFHFIGELAQLHRAPDVAALASRVEFLGDRTLGATVALLAVADELGGFRMIAGTQPRAIVQAELLDGLCVERLGDSEAIRAAVRVAQLSARPLEVGTAELFPGHEASPIASKFLVTALVHDRELVGGLLFGVRPDPFIEAMVMAIGGHVAVALDQLRQRDAARRLHAIDEDLWVPDEQFFVDQLRREVSRARRYERSVGVARFAVVNRPQISSVLGDFQTGHLIRRIGATLARSIRDTDILAVLDSGYAVIHTDTSRDGTLISSRRLAESIRLAVGRTFTSAPGPELDVRCGAYPEDADSVEGLIAYLVPAPDLAQVP